MTFWAVIAILIAAALLCLAMSVYWAARAINDYVKYMKEHRR
ncbi:MAG: hypothetical protein PWQ08_1096 [Clostridiales bacterium]|jgi:cell division protein FtsX|nr:hypothetical protein [Clostridiales bacterium]